MKVTAEQVHAGQAQYTRGFLAIYDYLVLGALNRFVWRCPTGALVALYDRNVSANHLDVGVGTGYFLDRCRFPSASPRIALVDLNGNALDFASQRIARYRPETYRRNVLEPIAIDAPQFDSVGLGYLLHCIPGTIESKGVVFDHLKALMNPGAVLFGATLLHDGVHRSALARAMMESNNRKGIFCNRKDDLDGLKRALGGRFRDSTVDVVGCAALFSARA